jgi:hypothetical protein
MHVTAVFESWHIGDGNYPPLATGEIVNLAYQVEANEPLARDEPAPWFQVDDFAECAFRARVLAVFRQGRGSPVVALDAGDFRFYVERDDCSVLSPGDWVRGRGTLLFDYYVWSETICKDKDAPDIFRTQRVQRIRRVRLPSKHVHRAGSSVSHPTRLPPAEFGPDDIVELSTMEGEELSEEFFFIDLDDAPAETVAKRTFLGG